jgi:alpha-beta hydrolase superfamily lysophospholipase
MYRGFRHEPLREAGRERVFADILSWVTQRSALIPSPGTPGEG